MKNTDISDPNYFHKVGIANMPVWRTRPSPNIWLIAAGCHSTLHDQLKSNVFLGHSRPYPTSLNRPAAVRVEDEPVAICRLKRVAADFKDDINRAAARLAKKTC